MTPTPDPETPAEHLRHAISDALRHLDIEANHRDDQQFAGVARAILRGQTATLARLAEVEQERDYIRDRYNEDVHDFWGLNEKAKAAEARAEAAEGLIELARAHVETTLQCPGQSLTFYGQRDKQLEAILTEPADAEGAG
jgi:hypothetical protein